MASLAEHTGNNQTAAHLLANTTTPWDVEAALRLTTAVGITDIVLGVLLNSLLIGTVLGSPALRHDVRNMLIVNMAVGDLLVAGVLQPLDVAVGLGGGGGGVGWGGGGGVGGGGGGWGVGGGGGGGVGGGGGGGWTYGCYTHVAVQLLRLFAFSFLSVWGLVCLDSLLLARLCRLDTPLSSFLTSAVTTSVSVWRRRWDRAVLVLVLVLPWALSVIVVTPVVFRGLSGEAAWRDSWGDSWGDSWCPLLLERWAVLALDIVFFVLPGVVVLVLLGVTGCVLYRRSGGKGGGIGTIEPGSMPPTVTALRLGTASSAGNHDRPSAYVAASVLTLMLTGPRHVLSLVEEHHAGLWRDTWRDRSLSLWLGVSLECLSLSKVFLLPLVWILALPDLRARALDLWTSAKKVVLRVKDESGFDPSVSYSNIDA